MKNLRSPGSEGMMSSIWPFHFRDVQMWDNIGLWSLANLVVDEVFRWRMEVMVGFLTEDVEGFLALHKELMLI